MTDEIATIYDEDSPTAEPEDDLTDELEDASEAASSSESEPPTSDDEPEDDADEPEEGAPVGGAEEVAVDLPSRLVARMGGEHAAWTFADASDGEAWAQAAFEFCSRYCPLSSRCPGDECRLHRFEGQARAVAGAA